MKVSVDVIINKVLGKFQLTMSLGNNLVGSILSNLLTVPIKYQLHNNNDNHLTFFFFV